MNKDLSIEYAHIYTNDQIREEHKLSIEILGNIIKEQKNKSFSLTVMVDDYSFPDPSFNYDKFVGWLKEHGFKPDVVIRESQLIPLCDEVLKIVKDIELKEEISQYVRKNKYPCSLFIASWYLLRLGYIESVVFDKKYVAEKLINILPLSFKPFEDKAFKIIKETEFNKAVHRIENKYFEGRKIK